MPASAEYQPGGDNGVLRSVLYDVWAYRCYWCNRPVDYTDTQIDHIIPKKLPDGRLPQVLRELAVEKDYNLDASYNLALICASCNSQKSNHEFVLVPLVLNRLKKARTLSPKVVAAVQAFSRSGDVASALLLATQAPLKGTAAERAFLEHAPAVVQRLALLDESRLHHTSLRKLALDLGDGLSLQVSAALDPAAQRALVVLEDVCDGNLEDLVQVPLLDVYTKLHIDVESAFEGIDGPASGTNSGPPESDFFRLDIDSITCSRDGDALQFEFSGPFDASMSASLVQSNEDGIGLLDLQGDAVVSGRYMFEARFVLVAAANLEVFEPYVDEYDIDVFTSV